MASDATIDDFEKSAGGLDFDEPLRERAAAFGASLAEDGPGAIFEQIEELLPDPLKEQISNFPITAVALGFGIGVYLGMRKSGEILAAGTAMVSAAASANVSKVLSQVIK